MARGTLEIDGKEYPTKTISCVDTHPNPDPDTWSAVLAYPESLNIGDTAVIKRDGTTIFTGILEKITRKLGSNGIETHVGGRHVKVCLWRRWAERNEDPNAGGFWKDYLPHKIFQFYLYPSKSDVSRLHRIGWGINPGGEWVITTNPAGSNPHRVKDRLISLAWESGVNQADGHYVAVDLGSAKSVCAVRVENRKDDNYPEHYRIQYSTTGAWAGEEVNVASVLNNTAHNIVHAWTAVSARYWRIYLDDQGTATHPTREWSVGEIFLYESDGAITGISEGTLDSHAVLDEALDFTWSRRTEILQKITDITETAFVPWEWWVDNNGAAHFKQRRGTDKSATIRFKYGEIMLTDSYTQECTEKAQRVKVLGKGTGNEQDRTHSSDWVGSGDYERVFVHKELESVDACTAKANIYKTELENDKVTITATVVDTFSTNSWGVGDDVTLTDVNTGLSGAYRVKKITRIYGKGETVTIEATNYKQSIVDIYKKLHRDLKYLQFMKDENKSVGWSEVDENFSVELGLNRPSFLDDGNYFKTGLWTIGGTNPVTPYVSNIDSYPALTVETAGANGDQTYIKTSDAWSGEKWIWVGKFKLAETTNNVVTFGVRTVAGGDEIVFEWDASAGTFSAICTAAKTSTSTALTNYPDLTNWHIYRIEWNSSIEVKFYIDGKLYATITTNIPLTQLPYYIRVYASAAAVKTLYMRAVGGVAQISEE